jgi:hypothetical protein
MKSDENDIKIDSDWCYYLVAFLDVLGQKDAFNRVGEIRSYNEVDDEFKREISGNLLYLEKFRENIGDFFADYTKEEQSKVVVEESAKGKFDQMRKAAINFQFFSDSLIAFVPLEFKSFYSVTVNGVWGILGACGAAFLGSLALDHSVRGGIEISWGTKLKNGEIYGPALNKAYCLESKVAHNPRIIIGDGVWNYLNSLSNKVQQHPAQTQIDVDACKGMADRCLNLISRDTDDLLIMDYLGKGFLELNKYSLEYFSLYDLSKKFICDSLAMWQQKQDWNILSKYQYLNDYFERKSVLVENARKALKVRG